MLEPDVPIAPVRRWRVWVALAVSAIAIPIIVIDNLPDDSDDTSPVDSVNVVAPTAAPADRPASGPPKGVSVVTSSTTSSTLPLTTTTTTTPA